MDKSRLTAKSHVVDRESKEAFGERWGLEQADKKTMGMSMIVDSDLDREYTEGKARVLNISATLFRRLDYNYTSFGFPH